jgi:hypothetical protein
LSDSKLLTKICGPKEEEEVLTKWRQQGPKNVGKLLPDYMTKQTRKKSAFHRCRENMKSDKKLMVFKTVSFQHFMQQCKFLKSEMT